MRAISDVRCRVRGPKAQFSQPLPLLTDRAASFFFFFVFSLEHGLEYIVFPSSSSARPQLPAPGPDLPYTKGPGGDPTGTASPGIGRSFILRSAFCIFQYSFRFSPVSLFENISRVRSRSIINQGIVYPLPTTAYSLPLSPFPAPYFYHTLAAPPPRRQNVL